MSQSSRVAIVTGATQGLGRVVAGILADRGFDLAEVAPPHADSDEALRAAMVLQLPPRH